MIGKQEKYVLRWQVPGKIGERLPEGVISIDGEEFRRVKRSFSTFRKRTFSGNRRGYENQYQSKTYIFFDEHKRTIVMEGPNERIVNEWAGDLQLNLYKGFGG